MQLEVWIRGLLLLRGGISAWHRLRGRGRRCRLAWSSGWRRSIAGIAPGRRLISGSWSRVRWSGSCVVGRAVALQLEVDRSYFERHLVARGQRGIELGIELVNLVIP